ncbi:GGDEF domain-containing protein [Aliidiomarina celeris]|uniref:GGDEF domain-containing protein n=1 Tax=Aliidiomarina celeris TaxID=2249428 RepID=UPI000DE89E7C|nr:GGDEF domain-containing protein [Aliidiomarina celeris]
MHKTELNIDNLHWILQILQNIEVGLIVFDEHYSVNVWNGFMENHSGISSAKARNKNLFDLLPSLPRSWFEQKAAAVKALGIQAHCNWRQEPHSLLFPHIRPYTAPSELMFQNITLFPLYGATKEIEQVCALIYDVSEEANSLLKLQSLSRTDTLSQLFNRGHWQELFEQEFARCQRYNEDCAVILLDIDHFKRVNDTYGHQVGDQAIKAIAQVIRDSQRETDLCGRYGGEEFVVTMPHTTLESAMAVAERLRAKVEAHQLAIKHEGKPTTLKLTISLGVAAFSHHYKNAAEWLNSADMALYQAKQNGRNQAVQAEQPR